MNNYENRDLFGSWRIVRLLGAGSYGKVYEISQNDGTENSALKIISIPENQKDYDEAVSSFGGVEAAEKYFGELKDKLINEIILLNKLMGITNIVCYQNHAIIPHDEGFGWDILIQMELLQTLGSYYGAKKTISTQDIIQLGMDICQALQRCQKYNIVHRDIKPDNIMVSQAGDYKLGDFGVSCIFSNERTKKMSKKGTEYYMAPELIYPDRESDSRVDIYSLGIVMYRLLNANRFPFLPNYPQEYDIISAEDEAFARRLKGEKLPAPLYAAGTRLGEIVLKACEPDPQNRYFSPHEMYEDLAAIKLTHEERILFEVSRNGSAISYHPTEIQPRIANVKITGHTGTFDYDKTEKIVEGFETNAGGVNVLVSLNHGKKAEVRQTKPGRYPMGLTREDFTVTCADTLVRIGEVTVEDGWLEIQDKKDQKKEKKEKKPRSKAANGLIIAALLIVAFAVTFLNVYLEDSQEDPVYVAPSASGSTSGTTGFSLEDLDIEVVLNKDPVVVLDLNPNEEASYSQSEQDFTLVHDRLEAMVNAADSSMKVDGLTIHATIPHEVFGKNTSLPTILKTTVVYPMVLNFAKVEDYGGGVYSDNEITRDMVVSAEAVTVKQMHTELNMPMVQKDIFGNVCQLEDNMPCIKLVLTPEGVATSENLSADEGYLTIGSDLGFDGTYHDIMYQADDGVTFVLLDPVWGSEEQMPIYAAMAKAYSQNTTLSTNYYCHYEVSPEFTWESPSEADAPGQYQMGYEYLPENRIHMSFFADSHMAVPEGDFQKHVQLLRDRLDLIGAPYAVGYSNHYDQEIGICTVTDRLCPNLLPLLWDDYLSTATLYGRAETRRLSIQQAEVVKLPDSEHYGLKVTFTDREELRNVAIAMNKYSDTTLLLRGKLPVVSCKVNYIPDEPYLIFDQLPIINQDHVDEDNRYILDIAADIINTKYQNEFEDYQTFKMDEEDSWSYSTQNMEYGKTVFSDREQEIFEIMAQEYPEVKVSYEETIGGARLWVELKSSPSSDFIKKDIDLTEKIFTRCNMDDSIFDTVLFVFIDEEGDARCRMVFERSSTNPAVMDAMGLCYGGLLDGYAQEFETYAMTKYFYQNKNMTMRK